MSGLHKRAFKEFIINHLATILNIPERRRVSQLRGRAVGSLTNSGDNIIFTYFAPNFLFTVTVFTESRLILAQNNKMGLCPHCSNCRKGNSIIK